MLLEFLLHLLASQKLMSVLAILGYSMFVQLPDLSFHGLPCVASTRKATKFASPHAGGYGKLLREVRVRGIAPQGRSSSPQGRACCWLLHTVFLRKLVGLHARST